MNKQDIENKLKSLPSTSNETLKDILVGLYQGKPLQLVPFNYYYPKVSTATSSGSCVTSTESIVTSPESMFSSIV